MKLRQITEGLKNNYGVGDTVNTPFGVGRIVQDIGPNPKDKFSDHMFMVLFDGETAQKYNLESNPVLMPSLHLTHTKGDSMTEANMTDPDYQSFNYGARNMDNQYDNVEPKPQGASGYGDQHSTHVSYDTVMGKNNDFPPVEELTPEQLQQQIEEEEERKRKVDAHLARLKQVYARVKIGK